MIWIIGGTSEARELVEKLGDVDYLITLATESGGQFFQGLNYRIGRLDSQAMEALCTKEGVSLIVDLSHPYARIVSEEARQVAQKLGLDYLRYLREPTKALGDVIYLASYEEAYKFLEGIEGTVFFTTGSKNIGDFEKVRGKKRFIYRILPALESLEICKRESIAMEDIVAMLGPFSTELNLALFKEFSPDYCLMKDSGKRGGTQEKLEACSQLGITALIIDRYEEKGLTDLDSLAEEIKKRSIKWKE